MYDELTTEFHSTIMSLQNAIHEYDALICVYTRICMCVYVYAYAHWARVMPEKVCLLEYEPLLT